MDNQKLHKVCSAICKSRMFETGQGTCAALCMDQLGDARYDCNHVDIIHGKLAIQILIAIAKPHKAQPSFEQANIKEPWQPMSEEMQKGLDLAAYICRLYGDGEPFAEAILSRGEQVRGRWWMEHEKRNAAK